MSRPFRRLSQLFVGLVLYATSMAMMIRSGLGVMPWDVLHQGLAHNLGISFGAVVMIVGGVVLLAWIPLRERPGLGTISNVIVIGLVVNVALSAIPRAHGALAQVSLAAGGILLNGVATAAYIGVRLGPGPRDGLMTGLVRRTGASVRVVRTAIEVSVVISGWLLGGTFGAVTIAYALSIGPIVQNTVAGLQQVPAASLEAGRGLGMRPGQLLRRVELPLAAPLIVSGIRTSVVINIGTAAIASTVGVRTLGVPIVLGLIGANLAYVLQGSVLVALMAVVLDLGFERATAALQRWREA